MFVHDRKQYNTGFLRSETRQLKDFLDIKNGVNPFDAFVGLGFEHSTVFSFPD